MHKTLKNTMGWYEKSDTEGVNLPSLLCKAISSTLKKSFTIVHLHYQLWAEVKQK